ncbi:hypothetical protein [uncultured Photobacterium sp.]|uniref:hypothetical protein n=1 Tax=uncultured Photobacterium sp. TaxID=173973 RepID=UPI00262DCBEB|nr:hypothetical protein [uncultured Photobacterium sp.]
MKSHHSRIHSQVNNRWHTRDKTVRNHGMNDVSFIGDMDTPLMAQVNELEDKYWNL